MKYEMPHLTDEKRAQLIADGVKALGLHDGAVGDLIQIALAALTAAQADRIVDSGDGQLIGDKVVSDKVNYVWPVDTIFYTMPPVPTLKPIKLAKGALMVSMYDSNNIDADCWLCLDKDGVIEAIKAAGGTIEGLDG